MGDSMTCDETPFGDFGRAYRHGIRLRFRTEFGLTCTNAPVECRILVF